MRLSVDDVLLCPVRQLSLTLYRPFFPLCTETATNIKMSFGFSVGDFATAIQLANKIRREFVDSPSQFKAVTDEFVAQS